MNRISLYSYDPKNWEQIVGEIASQDERIKIFSSMKKEIKNTEKTLPPLTCPAYGLINSVRILIVLLKGLLFVTL